MNISGLEYDKKEEERLASRVREIRDTSLVCQDGPYPGLNFSQDAAGKTATMSICSTVQEGSTASNKTAILLAAIILELMEESKKGSGSSQLSSA